VNGAVDVAEDQQRRADNTVDLHGLFLGGIAHSGAGADLRETAKISTIGAYQAAITTCRDRRRPE
jgi:hypothetical protein